MSFRIGASSSSFGASSSRMDDNSDLLSLLEGNLGKSSATRFDLSLVPLLLSNSMNESRTDPLQCSTPHHELEDMNFDADLHAKLQRAFAEIAKLKKENYEESSRRQEAEKELLMVYQKAKKLQDYLKEFRPPKEFEEARARNKQEIEILKKEIEQLKIQRDEYLENFQVANEQKLALVQCVSDSDRAANALENDLEAYKCVLDSMQMEYDQMQRERDTAVRDAEELRKNSEFSLPELELATENFSASRKIGEGGFGRVYKGSIRNTTVAIKMLRPENLQGQLQFEQEVSILSKVRHPHLVTFIGACQEASGLVYEYLPNGSLEDRLACTGNTPALTWRARTRIIGEICSALMFLHNHTPQPVVHGDLKPSNILLDANFVSKLSDFGIARLLVQSETGTMLYHTVHPMGTPAYSDPEYIATGELTSQSDVYSFGIIILRLLTGKPPVGIAKEVEEAMASDALHTIIDESAGDWPFVQAQQLAHIGMRCAAMSRRERPDLINDVWTVVGPMMKSASLSASPSTSLSVHDESNVPFYFVCPIFQEVMTDPHIAADGFTYEAEAIEGWLNGHDTSPMTNVALPSRNLIPNHALRSAIQEYLHHQVGSDVADALMSGLAGKSYVVDREPCPSLGRVIDRPSSRGDCRGTAIDDDKRTKLGGPFSPARDSWLDMGYGPAVMNFRSVPGVSHGVLRNLHGQPPSQYISGILAGPMQSIASQLPRSGSDADRWQQRGLIPSPVTPMQILHKAEKKYEVGKVSNQEEAKQRQMRGILNKLAPQNFDKLFAQVKEVNIDSVVTLIGVVSQIFGKALMEPTFCEMYANFCFHLAGALPDFSEDNEKITFKRLLLNICQEEFERGEREEAEADKTEEEGEVKQTKEEREEKRIRARRRMLGNIRLIGELYKKRMLTERIMHECIKKLLGNYQNPDEEDVEALCKLMSTIGEMIDHPKAKEHMDAYFDIMHKLSTNQKLSSRVKFMLRDSIDLRRNKWQQRRKVEGPKKIDEVHRDAAQERQAQSSRLACGPRQKYTSIWVKKVSFI